MKLRVEAIGNGPRVVLVHGGMGYPSWRRQKPLAEKFRLEMLTRPGYPPNPPEPALDFEREAELVADHLAGGAHLVGHSHGGTICLLAAAQRPQAVLSLTLTEPNCFAIARGHPAVEALITGLQKLRAAGIDDPRAFVTQFMGVLGLTAQLPDPLPPPLAQSIRALMVERPPWEAEIPLADLRRASYPKLVVSGADSHPAHIAVCDVLEQELGMQRAILADTDHRIMHSPDFNGVLDTFLLDSLRNATPAPESETRGPWPAHHGGEPLMSTDEKSPNDALERSKHLWEEYKYRHDLIWQRIFRFTAVYALMGVVPYVQQDIARILQYSILIVPLLGLLSSLVALTVMNNELAIFGRIKQAYRRQQNQMLDADLAHPPEEKDRFDTQVRCYFRVLILLAIVNFMIVWRVFIPGLPAQPVCR